MLTRSSTLTRGSCCRARPRCAWPRSDGDRGGECVDLWLLRRLSWRYSERRVSPSNGYATAGTGSPAVACAVPMLAFTPLEPTRRRLASRYLDTGPRGRLPPPRHGLAADCRSVCAPGGSLSSLQACPLARRNMLCIHEVGDEADYAIMGPSRVDAQSSGGVACAGAPLFFWFLHVDK